MSPPPIPQTQRSWWSRNWKWVVPVLVACLIIGALVVGGVAAIFGVMRSTTVYQTALAKAKADPRVVAALGSPISDSLIFTGNVSVNNDYGQANLVVPLHGPRNTAVLFAVADKRPHSEWEYSILTVQVGAHGEKINLREGVDEGHPTQPNTP